MPRLVDALADEIYTAYGVHTACPCRLTHFRDIPKRHSETALRDNIPKQYFESKQYFRAIFEAIFQNNGSATV